MIAVDSNLLVFAHREDSEWHEKAAGLLTQLANSTAPWAIPWPCVHEFIAITTHPKIYHPPTPLNTALAAVEEWMKSPNLRLLHEGPGYFEKLRRLSKSAKVQGGMIHDARIAALCINHGVKVLWSADRDFSRFGELKTVNPLV
jgi:toxin-antitoxin system PIN domain toxin